MSALDRLAERMFGRQRLETTAAMASVDTQTYIGVATSDSADGSVSVVLSDDVTQPDGGIWDGETFLASDELGTSVELPTTTAVKEGDRVLVTASGANVMTAPVVTGVVGRGDEQQAQIDAAAEAAASVEAEVEQVRQDVADFRDDVATTYATKVEREDGDDAVKTWVTTNYTNSNDLATTYATKTLVSQTKDAIELAASQTYETQSDAAATYATKSALTVGLDGIRSEVAEDYQPKGDYATTASMTSAIQQSASSIESSVAATYETKSDAAATYATKTEVQQTAAGLDTRITTAQSTADGAYLERTATGTTIDTTGAATIRSLVVEGQSVQDGTPTPDAPVPIKSVEGWNLLDDSNVYQMAAGGTGIVSSTSYRSVWCEIPPASSTRTFSVVRNTVEGNRFRIFGTKVKPADGVTLYSLFSGNDTELAATFSVDATYKFIFVYLSNAGGTISAGNIAIYEGADAPSTVIPYGCVTLVAGSTRTDIDLQGHALRSLPDGTHDEMAVDSLGRVTMTQRVGSVTLDGSNVTGTIDYPHTSTIVCATDVEFLTGSIRAKDPGQTTNDAYMSTCAPGANYGTFRNNDIALCSVVNSGMRPALRLPTSIATSLSEAQTWLAANPTTVLYPLATPQTIDLGTIDLPTPADTLWLDAAIVPTIEATWWTVDGIAGQQALDAEVTERQTLIRQFSGGVLAGYVGNAIAALVNAAGSFDVVRTAWSNGVPSILGTLARYAASGISLFDAAGNVLAEFASDHVRIGGDVPDGTGVESAVQFFDQTETHDTDMTASTYFDGGSGYQTMQSTVNLSSTLADEGKAIDTGSSGTAALDLVNMLENGISATDEQHNEVIAALVADASYSDGDTTSHAAVRATATTTNGRHLSYAELIADAIGIGTDEGSIDYYTMSNVRKALDKALSLTPTPFELWAGSKIVNVGTSAVSTFTLFTKAQLQAIVGTSWTPTGINCAVFVMNGDYGVTDAIMTSSIASTSIVRVHMSKTRTGNVRVNYLIIRFAA